MMRHERRKTRGDQPERAERHETPTEDGPPRLDLGPVRASPRDLFTLAGKAVNLIGQLVKAAEAVDHLFKHWN